MLPSHLIDDALQADHETDIWDFKVSLDIGIKGELLELVKDIVSMANSGGGVILVGLDDNGVPSGSDVNGLLAFDPAKMTDQLAVATGRQFSDFRITAAHKGGQTIAAITVGGVPVPLVTINPGNYQDPDNPSKQKTAFSRGIAYFRHGAKSEPGTTEDLERVIKREIEAAREGWLGNVRQVLEAPPDSRVVVLAPGQAAPDGIPVRIVNNPEAPAVHLYERDWRDIYRYTYQQLTDIVRDRYVDFKVNRTYHRLRRALESDRRYCETRHLDPRNPRSSKQQYYSEATIDELDKHYTRHPDD